MEELLLLQEEKVSIAALHEQPISQAPSNVYVITDEDIRHSGATDLPTILRRIPGLEVMQMSGADFNVSARGNNQPGANKMLVLVDGRSIYLDVQGVVHWKMIPVTLPEIRRIEVLKGPASALYGFNAFDGVVNIITKSPEEMKGTTLQFGGGEFGTITSSAIQAGTFEKLGYRLSVGRDQNNQWRSRDALAFRSHKFNVQTEYALPGESKLLVAGGLVDVNRFDGPIQETVTSRFTATDRYAMVAYQRRNLLIRSFWKGEDFTSDVGTHPSLASFGPGGTSSIRVTDRNGIQTQSVGPNTYDFEAQHGLEFGTAMRLTYGLNYRHNTISSNYIDGFSREDRLGLFLHNEWKAAPVLSVVAGLRYDLHTEINPTVSPRLALLYTAAPDHTFRVAGSVAYRPPTLLETHFSGQTIVTLFGITCPAFVVPCPVIIQGSRNLDPEQIISYEAGYQGWFFKHRLRARIDLFFNHISDLISSSGGTFHNNNNSVDIYGGEAGVEFLATSWLSGFVNYAYEEFGQTFPVGDTVQRGAPRFKVNAGVRGEWDNGLNTEVALHYVGAAIYPISATFANFAAPPFGVIPPEQRVGSYTLLNLRGAYRFWQEKAEAAVTVFNAFNDQHHEHGLGDTIGSRVMGWLTIRF